MEALSIQKGERLTSLVVQWLRLHTSNVGGVGSIQKLRSHMPCHGQKRKDKEKERSLSYCYMTTCGVSPRTALQIPAPGLGGGYLKPAPYHVNQPWAEALRPAQRQSLWRVTSFPAVPAAGTRAESKGSQEPHRPSGAQEYAVDQNQSKDRMGWTGRWLWSLELH